MKKGIVYKAVNKITREIYIGVTFLSMLSRKKDHQQKANTKVGGIFQNAIGTFGEEAFEWEQIDSATCCNELAEKEKRYILEYNTLDKGYNSDRGGGVKKNIFKYDYETGELLSTFPSLSEAAQDVGVDKKTISKACLGEIKYCKGYFWSYQLQDNIETPVDKRKKRVFQFNLKGHYLRSFNSVSKAAKTTGINKSSIAKCCRGEYRFAGEFVWQYGQ